MSPPRLNALVPDPRKLAGALPTLFSRLEEIARATAHMPAMRAGIQSMAEDTTQLAGIREDLGQLRELLESLPDIDRGVRQVAVDTDALPAVRDELRTVAQAVVVLRTMDGRMEQIEGSMPVLVEVQQHLARLPEIIESISGALDRLAVMLDRLLTSVEMLDGHVGALQESMQPIARVADRLPGSRRHAD
jgi:hypothetical protein